MYEEVARMLDAIAPDVVAIPGFYDNGALSAIRWCRDNNIPCVLMSASTQHDSPRYFWKEWIKKQLVSCFSATLVGGQPQRDYVCRLGISADRIFAGYNAIDNAYFQKRAEHFKAAEQDLRKEFNLNRPFFLVVGRFIPEKNLFRLMDAYMSYRHKIRERADDKTGTDDPWDLLILGDGELRGRLWEHIGSLGLTYESYMEGQEKSSTEEASATVHLRGFAQYDELPKYYALAECMMLPSLKDTWGLVVNEAMASGLPVIVSKRCGCAQDLVEDGKNGFLINPFNVDDMAEKMLQMTRLSEAARKAMGQKSRKIISFWGCGNFGENLWRATKLAYQQPVKRSNKLASLILQSLTFFK